MLPKSVHYGWWIAAGLSVLMFATIGVGYYGLAVFLRPLQEENGWSNTAVSGATGMYFTVSGLTGFVIGPMVDRNGPRRYLLAGVTLVGLSAIALGSVSSLFGLYLVYFLQAVAFGMAGAVPVNSIMARWFVTRRAQAMSISATGVSMGGIVLSPLGSWLVGVGGVALAAPIMGLLVLAVGVPIVLWVLAWEPAEVGVGVDVDAPLSLRRTPTRSSGRRRPGDSQSDAAGGLLNDPADDPLSDRVQTRTWTRSTAARTVPFWSILTAFLLVLMAQTGFLLHQIAFLEDRFGSRDRAALALSLTALGSVVARLIVGRYADRLDKVTVAAWLFVVQGLAVLGVVYVEGTGPTYLFVLIVGFTIGNIYMVQALLVAEIFGQVSLGTVMGVIGLAAQVGSGAGPFLVGWLEDSTGAYRLPFTASALTTIVCAAVILLARIPVGLEPTEHWPSAVGPGDPEPADLEPSGLDPWTRR